MSVKNEKYDELFNAENLHKELANKTLVGSGFAALGQFLKLALLILSNVILARMLSPDDFGLVAMVAVFTGFIFIFRDLGLSTATIQKQDINHEQVSTLFWVNILIGLMLTAITVLVAPLIANFYDDQRLEGIAIALSVGVLFIGFGIQHQALLRRQLKHGQIAVIEVIATLLGICIGVLCALLEFGYWSLVAIQVSTPLFMSLGNWLVCSWVPGMPKRNCEIRDMLAFGGYITGFGIINYFSRNLDNMLIGWRWGSYSVGQYSRAYSLLLLPIGQLVAPLTAVAVPALSRMQDQRERFNKYYLNLVKIVAYLSMPMITLLAVLSEEIIFLLLGSQWVEASHIFKVLAVAAFWQPICATVGWIYVSSGNTKRMFKWALINTPITVLGFYIGLNWGAYGVAAAYACVVTFLVLPTFLFAFKGMGISVGSLFNTIKYAIASSIVLSISSIYLKSFFAEFNNVLVILFTLIAAIVVLIAMVLIIPGFKEEITVMKESYANIKKNNGIL